MAELSEQELQNLGARIGYLVSPGLMSLVDAALQSAVALGYARGLEDAALRCDQHAKDCITDLGRLASVSCAAAEQQSRSDG